MKKRGIFAGELHMNENILAYTEFFRNNIDGIIKKLDEDGIVYEGDFGITRVAIERNFLLEPLLAEKQRSIQIMATAVECEDCGCMYALYDSDIMSGKEARSLIYKHFTGREYNGY